MKHNEELALDNGGKIHVAQIKHGGNSSWGVKENYKDDSIRLAWYSKKGRFDPYSSAELPMWGLKKLTKIAVQRDMLSKDDLEELIGAITTSYIRQQINDNLIEK